MLKNIPKTISPELLKILCEMCHGDELVIADANFPAASMAKRLIRADGIRADDMLKAVLQLILLDQYDNRHFILMERCAEDTFEIQSWKKYEEILKKTGEQYYISHLERFAYYERAKEAYAVVATGETEQYSNLILKKGCIK